MPKGTQSVLFLCFIIDKIELANLAQQLVPFGRPTRFLGMAGGGTLVPLKGLLVL